MDAPAHVIAAHIAGRRHGVVAQGELRRAGLSRAQVQHLLDCGALTREWHGAYRVAGAPRTWKGDVLAGCLAGGTRAVASHRSAASLWETGGGDRRIVELMCPRWRRARHPGLIVHETKCLDPRDVTVVDGIPVTSVERTILDLGAVRSAATVERAMETALRKELTTLGSLRATVHRLGRQGRNGAGVLRALLDARDPDRRLTESEMEMLMVQVLRANGLPEPVLQHEIWHHRRFVARVDAAFVEWMIALEYESFEWHTGKAALVRDSARRNAMVGAGWRPISVTWDDLKSGGHQVCADLLRARRHAA